jgi:hypothetical protein
VRGAADKKRPKRKGKEGKEEDCCAIGAGNCTTAERKRPEKKNIRAIEAEQGTKGG